MVRTPDEVYCDAWNLIEWKPTNLITRRTAAARHRARTPYLAAVLKTNEPFVKTALVAYRFDDPPYASVRLLDVSRRIMAYRGFVQLSAEMLFLAEYGVYGYDLDVLVRSDCYYYSTDGRVHLSQMIRGTTQHRRSRIDTRAHYLPLPRFGEHAALVEFDHLRRVAPWA